MKFLIWFGCFFLNAIITVLINSAGILLGGIPTALLFFGCFMLAKTLCKKWDEHKEAKVPKSKTPKPTEATDDKLINLFAEAFADAAKNSCETGPILLKGQRPNENDYGYSESNPICSSTLTGTDIYLGKLRTTDGKKFTWQRIGDVRADCNSVTDVGMDKYQLYLDGKPYKVLYVIPYVAEATNPPYGLVLLDKSFETDSTVPNTINNLDEITQEPQNADNIEPPTTEQAPNKKSLRYCAFCGNIIDDTTKKCTSCGEPCKNNKILILVFLIIIALLLIVVGMFLIINPPIESRSISNSSISSTSSNINSTTVLHQHSYSKTVEKPSSCKEEGLAKFTCNCGDTYTESIAKSEHSYSNATCTKPKTCSTCGYTQGTSLGHSVIDGICTNCHSIILTSNDLQGTWKSTWNTPTAYRQISFSGNAYYYEFYCPVPEYGYTDYITMTGTFSIKNNVLTIHATATNTRTTESGSETKTYPYNYDDIITKYTPSSLSIEGLQPFYKQ